MKSAILFILFRFVDGLIEIVCVCKLLRAYILQIMIQTLPFMACLEKLEVDIAQKGAIGDISIIPHAADSVRIVFSST